MVPSTVNGISLLQSPVLSAVECSIVLNLQFERLCVLCPYHMDLSADASYMYLQTLPHIKICSFSPTLKDTDKL